MFTPDERRVGRAGVQAAVFGEHVVGTHRIGVVVGHPARTVGAARLLIGHREVDQVCGRAEPARRGLVSQPAKRHSHRGREVEHVDGASAPHFAVDQFAAEGVVPPPFRMNGDDVGMSHQAQGRGSGVRARDSRHHRCPLVHRLEAFDVDAWPGDDLLEDVDVARFVPRVDRPVVDALVADQRLEQIDRPLGQTVE